MCLNFLQVLNNSWTGYDTAGIIIGHWKLLTNEVNETAWPLPTKDEVTREPKIADGNGDDVFDFLFNLKDDPYETNNLIDAEPTLASEMREKLATYRQGMANALFCRIKDGDAYPDLESSGGFVAPWVLGHAAVEAYRCPYRYLADGTIQRAFNPSFIDGSSYEGLGGSDDFGDDA